MTWRYILTLSGMLLLAAVSLATAETFDRPAAIVGNKIILESELQAQMQLIALQNKIDLTNPARRAELRADILRQMIDDRLILSEAEKDTTIAVSPEEIDQALNEHIESLRAQFAGDDAFEAQLLKEGLTLGELRRRFRKDAANQLLKQRLINSKLGNVSVTNGEVKEFYAQYIDSLPNMPASTKLGHLLLEIKIDTNRILATREKLTQIRAEIENGADFAQMAELYSDDPTGEVGGELGWFGPGDLVPEFEEAAQRLSPGQLSGVVRSPYGFHLIEVEEKKGPRFRTRHILLRLTADRADTAAVLALADSLLAEIRAGADFCKLVREYTTDNESRKNCGELGWYPVTQMYPEFQQALQDVDENGFAGPAISQFGVHILRVLDKRESRAYSLDEDWDTIKQMARRDKTNRVVSDWIAQIRGDIYLEIKKY